MAGLSEAQATFKEADDRWSVRDCVEHLALSEDFLRGAVGQAMQAPAAPERKEELKGKEDQVLQFVTDRSQKFQAAEPVRPTSRWNSLEATIEVFKASRKKTLDYAHTTEEDLRSHIIAFPAGDMDAYQFLLSSPATPSATRSRFRRSKRTRTFPRSSTGSVTTEET